MERIFVGLKISEPASAALHSLYSTHCNFRGVRWTPESNLHLTLHFVGEVPPETIGILATNLANIEHQQFDIRLGDIGSFPPRGTPKVLHCNVADEKNDLNLLHRKIINAVSESYLPTEKISFVPHITLARVGKADIKEICRWMELTNAEFAGVICNVKSFQLFRSVLKSRQPVEYDIIQEYVLGRLPIHEEGPSSSAGPSIIF